LSGFETLNLYNGNLNFRLPLLVVAGRGDARMTMTLAIERRFTVRKRGGSHELPVSYQVEGDSWSPLKPGYGPGVLGIRYAVQEVQKDAHGQVTKQRSVTRATFIAPDGSETELRDQALDGEPREWRHGWPKINRGKVFNATDGSAATFLSDTDVVDVEGASSRGKAHQGRLLWRNGTEYRIGNGLVGGRGLVHSIRDRNGNRMSFLYDNFNRVKEITDSLDRKVTVTYAGDTDVITYYGFHGDGVANGQRTIAVVRAPLHERLLAGTTKTNQELFDGIPDLLHPDQVFDPMVVARVELPNRTPSNNAQYDFFYNEYGELARCQLPTGGIIDYEWESGTDQRDNGVYDVSGAWEWIPDFAISRRVKSRKVYNYGELEQSTEYVLNKGCAPEGVCVDVRYLNPLNRALLGSERHYFSGDPLRSFSQAPVDYSGWRDGRELGVETLDAAGNLLRGTTSIWEQRTNVPWWHGDPSGEPAVDVRRAREITTLDTRQSSHVNYGYDDYNNVTLKEEFDYGSHIPSRTTETTYESLSHYVDPSYAHIRNLPKEVKVKESGVVRSHRQFFYDEQTLERPPAINLESLAPEREAYRGNQTRLWRRLDFLGRDSQPTSRRLGALTRSATSSKSWIPRATAPRSSTSTTSADPTGATRIRPDGTPTPSRRAPGTPRPTRRGRSTTTTWAVPWIGWTRTES
jgi:YD repeat-containing protein